MVQIVQHPCGQEFTNFRLGEMEHDVLLQVFFFIKENWLSIYKVCYLPCALLANIAISSSTMLQLFSMGNHF